MVNQPLIRSSQDSTYTYSGDENKQIKIVQYIQVLASLTGCERSALFRSGSSFHLTKEYSSIHLYPKSLYSQSHCIASSAQPSSTSGIERLDIRNRKLMQPCQHEHANMSMPFANLLSVITDLLTIIPFNPAVYLNLLLGLIAACISGPQHQLKNQLQEMVVLEGFVKENRVGVPRCGLYYDPRPGEQVYQEFDYSLPLGSVQIEVSIRHCLINVQQTLQYNNSQDRYIDAVYCFPVEPRAALHKFEAEMGGQVIIGKVKEKQQARKEFDEKKKQGATVAIVQAYQQSKDIIFIKLGNLPPKEPVTIRLSYVQEAEVTMNKFWSCMISNRVRPRYMAASSSIGVPPSYKWIFKVNLQTSTALTMYQSNTHKLHALDKSARSASLVLPLEEHPEKDFHFMYACEGMNDPRYVASADGLHGLLSFIPRFCQMSDSDALKQMGAWDVDGVQGEFVFLLDRSGSMSDGLIQKAKQALILFLRSLPVNCYFNVVSFGSKHDLLFKRSIKYSKESLHEALSKVQRMEADMGGTNIHSPLQAVYSLAVIPGYPRNVITLTDGGVGDTEKVLSLVERFVRHTRSSCIGIGQGASQALVKGIAERGLGEYSMLSIEDDLKGKVIEILMNLASPVLKDFSIKFDDALFQEILPNPAFLPYLQKNQAMNFYCKLRRRATDDDRVLLKFHNSMTQKEQQLALPLNCLLVADEAYKLFSFKKIRLLQNQQQSIKEKPMIRDWGTDIKKDIISESVRSQVLSQQTAWLAVIESDQIRVKFQHYKELQPKMALPSACKKRSAMVMRPMAKMTTSTLQQAKPMKMAQKKSVIQKQGENNCLGRGAVNQSRAQRFLSDERDQQDEKCESLMSIDAMPKSQKQKTKIDKKEKQKLKQKQTYKQKVKVKQKGKAEDPSQELDQVIALQDFDGHWDSSPRLMKILKIDQKQLKQVRMQQKALMTFLVLKWLQKKYPCMPELKGIMAKARAWMRSNAKAINEQQIQSVFI